MKKLIEIVKTVIAAYNKAWKEITNNYNASNKKSVKNEKPRARVYHFHSYK